MFEPRGSVSLKKGEGRLLKAGGQWIFDNEVSRREGNIENGGIISVLDFDGFFLGYGFYNEHSSIRIRMLARYRKEPPDEAFFRDRVKTAWEYRKAVVDTECCRLIFGEADHLPGLVVDKYGEILVVQSLALGIERLKPMILALLKEVLLEDGVRIRGIYERSDAEVRKKEGMPLYKGVLEGDFSPRFVIRENGIRYEIDVEKGQKTGFFLDQKYNRKAVGELVKRAGIRRVLDCFTNQGTFALNAALNGADRVEGLDISEEACTLASRNAKENGLSDRVRFRQADVLEELPKKIARGETYELVILDPPAFTKSRSATKQAVKGYREINMRGMKLTENGGYLATCSCSHFMTRELLLKTLREAAKAARKRLILVEERAQSPDHPVLLQHQLLGGEGENSGYLKFFIFRVTEEA